MSRILKRPMFRKGGEVMEGIMTGIKPREMFQAKGMSDSMRDDLKNIQSRVDLIDAFSGAGASPLGDPLTQFLLQTGQNLISGESAGGTKLQEIVGATRKPLDKAIKAQQVRDLSRKKIAASLLSKMGAGDIAKIKRNAKELSELLGIPIEQATQMEINKAYYKDPPSAAAKREKAITTLASNFMKEKKYGQNVYTGPQANALATAYVDAMGKKDYKGKIVPSQPSIPKKEEFTKVPTGNEKMPTAYKPKENTGITYLDNKIYFDIDMGTWLLYDQNQNLLFPYNK
jgi:hypothetical protein